MLIERALGGVFLVGKRATEKKRSEMCGRGDCFRQQRVVLSMHAANTLIHCCLAHFPSQESANHVCSCNSRTNDSSPSTTSPSVLNSVLAWSTWTTSSSSFRSGTRPARRASAPSPDRTTAVPPARCSSTTSRGGTRSSTCRGGWRRHVSMRNPTWSSCSSGTKTIWSTGVRSAPRKARRLLKPMASSSWKRLPRRPTTSKRHSSTRQKRFIPKLRAERLMCPTRVMGSRLAWRPRDSCLDCRRSNRRRRDVARKIMTATVTDV
mmetsp:Transcript_18236/g.52001  ORF Transcript_18236/g.52001 Transcript_18236/m.52001 type:complete len:264 (-) Transcript_18236:1796-2587(-)